MLSLINNNDLSNHNTLESFNCGIEKCLQFCPLRERQVFNLLNSISSSLLMLFSYCRQNLTRNHFLADELCCAVR